MLKVLRDAFDLAIDDLGTRVTDTNREKVHEAVAGAIMDLAKAGQTDLQQLRRYAVDKGRNVLSNNVTFL
jgi:hypothetical protein